jgi:regulator of nucleoside diphosphate kinase
METLQGELDRAHIVNPTAVPHDVVTMNSRVRLTDVETNEEQVYTVVFPSESNLSQGKISILAPIGTAILGYRVGDTVEWCVPGGIRKLRIEEILYQPEAAGHRL